MLEPAAAAIIERAKSLSFQGRPEALLSELQTAAEHFPDAPEIFDAIAAACRELDKGEEAFRAAKRAFDLTPDDARRAISLADVLLDALQYEQAAELILKFEGEDVREMQSKIVDAYEKFQALREAFLVAMEQHPETSLYSSDFIETILKFCDWENSKSFISQIIAIVQSNVENHRPLGMSVNNLQAFPVSYEYIANAACASASALTANLTPSEKRARPIAKPRSGGRVRIGYLVTYVHFHSLPLLLKHIMERHDRDRFEVFGYCAGLIIEDEFSVGYRAAFDKFAACGDDAAITAQQIRDDEIDILIDVTGQGVGSCLDVTARQPAPLAVHFLGYSITTGADFIDYIVTDETYLQAQDLQHGPEIPIYMPNTFMAAVPMDMSKDVPSRAACGLPETGTVFCNFNQMFKFEPEIFRTWCRILLAVEGSVLWIGGWSSAAVHNLRREAQRNGVDPTRLVFGSIIEHPDHLARLEHADLCLDTFHHGGGVTTIDCLWVGVPVLTTRGSTPSSRLGSSILHGAGVDEMVLDDLEAFETRAIELGNDPNKLAALRQDWQARKQASALFDIDRYVKHLEFGYDLIWRKALDGDEPSPIHIPQIT